MSLDIVIAIMPISRPEITGAAAQLKAVIQENGFSCKVLDWNIDLYSKSEDKKNFLDKNANFQVSNDDPVWSDIFKKSVDEWIQELKILKPKWLGLSLFSYARTAKPTEYFLKKLKTEIPDLKVIVGGHAVSYLNIGAKIVEKKLADFYVNGEGEIPIINILNNKFEGDGINNNKVARVTDLDSLPLADFSDYNFDLYSRLDMPIFLSRGCVNNCSFCKKVLLRYYTKSGKNVADEMVHLYKTYGSTRFNFGDSLMSGNKKSFTEFIETLYNYVITGKIDKNIHWYGMLYAWPKSYIDESLFYKIKQSGCCSYVIGVESGSPKVRLDMNKRLTNESIDYTVQQCYKNKIPILMCLIVGYITETEEDFELTLDMLKRYEPYKDILTINIGSTYLHYPKENDVVTYDKNKRWIYKDNTMKVRVDRWFRLKDLVLKLGFELSENNLENLLKFKKLYENEE